MGNCLAPPKQGFQEGIEQQLNIDAFPPVDKDQKLQFSVLGLQQAQDVTDFYEIGSIIGAGQFGTIRSAVHRATGHKYACKSISKARITGMDGLSDVRREIQIMHHLAGHPNIVSLHAVYEDHVYVHLIMELCRGGDLVDNIMARGTYTERQAAQLIRTILKVVAYCHELGVVHRDLKPDNFLLADKSPDAELKVSDFGMSVFIKPGQRLRDVCGTAFYIAPDVLMRDYDERADIWAVGVILYILLCGRPPFEDRDDDAIYRMVVEDGVPKFTSHLWENITQPAKDCVCRMMTYGGTLRPSAREMLDHEWVREGGLAGDNVIEPEVLHRLRSFAAMNRLKKQAMLFIGERLSPDEIRGLHELFESIDVDGSGTISLCELRSALISRGSNVSEDDLQQIINLADVNHDQEIQWKEFIGATLHVSKLLQEQHLMAAFRHFDADGSGFLTRSELESALKDSTLSEQQLQGDVDNVMKECDKNGDGLIDYAEFCQMMLPPDKISQSNADRFADNWAKQQARITRTAAAAAAKNKDTQQHEKCNEQSTELEVGGDVQQLDQWQVDKQQLSAGGAAASSRVLAAA